MNRKLLGLVLFLLFVNQIVWGQCPPNASVSLGSNQFYCSNTNVTLVPTINNAPSGNPTYSWTGPSGLISGQSGTTLTVPTNQSGTYSVSINYGNNCVLTNNVVVTFLPVPTITASQCISTGANANLSVNFSPALPSSITPTYSWTGPSGFTSTSANPTVSSFNSSKAGIYSVTVSFISSTGSTCTYNLSTTLNLAPLTPTFSIPANGCLSTNYSPTGFTAQPNTTYTWTVTPSSSSTGLNGPTPVFNFTNSGTYSISVTATQNGCSATSSSQGISILNLTNNLPSVDGTSSPQLINGINTFAICSGASTSTALVFNENLGGGNPNNPTNTVYTYTINGSTSSSFGSSIQVPINYGNNTFVSTASSGGCISTTTVNIYSGSNPYVSLGANNSINLCPGSIVNFVIDPTQSVGVTNPPGTTYTLTFSDVVGNTVYTDLTNDLTVPHTFNTTSCGVTNSGTTFPPNTYYALVTAQNPCGTSQSFYSPITVHNLPTAEFTLSDSTLCVGQTTTVVNTGTAGSVVGNTSPYNCSSQGKFYWQITGGVIGTNFTLAPGQQLGTLCSPSTTPPCSWNSTSSNGSSTLNITFLTAGYYTITQVYYNQCGQKTFTRNVCVIDPPTCQFTVSPNSGCSPLTVNINNTTVAPTCGGTPVPLTYTWTITSPTGTSASYTSNTSQVPPALTLTNPTSTPQTYTISLVVNPKDPYNTSQNFGNPNCISNCTQTVTVNPIPIFTPFNLTSCDSPYQANVNLQSSTNMTSTFSWVATPNANVFGESTTNQSSSIINDNLTNQSSTFQTITYSITPTSSLGCVGATQNSTISINTIVPGTISANQTICSGGDPQTLTGSAPSGLGTLTYQWQSSIDNVSWSNIANATSASYDPPPITSTIYYRRVVSYLSNGVTCSSNSNVVTITVNNINPGTIGAPQNICAGDDPVALSVVTSATGAGTLSYTWQSSTTSATSGFSNISSQTGTSYDPPIITTTTWYQLNVTSTLNGITCSQSTPSIAISVFNLNPGVIGSNQNICEGGDPSNITETTPASTSTGTLSYQWQSSIDNVSWTNISGATGSTFNPPILNSTTYYRRIVYVYSGSTLICQGYSNVVSIQVLPDPTVTTPTSQTICTGGSPAPISVSASGGINSNYTYQWYNASGLISGATQSTYTPSSSTGSYYCVVSIIPTTTTGCSVTSSNATVTVEPDPIVTAPQSATYCQNASTVTPLSVTASGGISSAYAYQWYSNTSNNTTSGIAIAAASGGTSASYTPPVNNTGTLYYYCVVSINPTSTGCSVTSAIATITVNSGPSISSQPQSQTICVGGTLNDLSVSYSGGSGNVTYQWYTNSTNSTSGGTPVGTSSNSYTLPATLNSSVGTSYYYCQLSFGGSGGCSQISTVVATISVLADPTFSVQPNPTQTICAGGTLASPLSATVTGGSGTNTYQWYTVNGSTYTPIANSNSSSYNPTAFANAGTFNYAVSVTQSVSGCASSNSNIAEVVVVPDPTVSITTGASYCQNASPVTPLSVTVTGGASVNYSYQWFNGSSQITGATSNTYTPSVATTGTSNYTCQVTISPAAIGCSTTSNQATITVTAGPTFTSQPQSQTICVGGTLNALSVTYSGGSGTASYQWYSNTTNANTGGTLLPGETNATLSLPSTLNNTTANSYYYCVISFGNGSGCSVITSNVATINVLADPIFSVQPNPTQTICAGGMLANPLSVTTTGGTGSPTYQWYTVSGTTYTPIPNSNSSTYNPIAFTNPGTFNFAVSVTQSVSGCASSNSNIAEVVVVADPAVSITTGASYCQNASPVAPLSVSVIGGNGSAYTYQWYTNTTNSNSGGNPLPNSNNASFTPPVSSTGTLYYYCLVTNSPASSGCSTSSGTATITVTSGPTFTSQPQSQTICLGGTLSALSVAYSGGSGTASYQWYSNTTNANTGGTLLQGETNASFTLPSTLNSTAANSYYYCVISFGTGSGCSVITSNVATISVLADPTFSVQPNPTQTICAGGTLASPLSATVTGGSGTNTYQWYTVNGSTYTPIANSNSSTYNPTAFANAGTFNYAVSVTQSVSGCASSNSNIAEVVVVPDPTVSITTGASYCQNASPVTPLSVTATGGASSNYSYQWFNGTNQITGATSNTYTPSVAATGTINYTCQVTISPAAIGCSTTSNQATIVVNAAPTFSSQPQATQTICLDGTFNALTVATQNGTGTPTFQWYSNSTNSTSNGTLLSGETNNSYTPPSNVIGTVYYFCIATFASGGCSSITSTIGVANVVADPIISIEPIPSQSICVGGTIGTPLTATATGGTGNTSYQWSNSSGPITGETNQNFTPLSFSTVGTYSYFVTISLSGSGCNSVVSQNAQIEVVADPTVSTQPITAEYCQNASPVSALTVSATGGIGTFSYQWYSNTTNSSTGGTLIPSATNSSYTPPVNTIGIKYYYCIISQTGLNCSVTSAVAAITVNAAPTFSTPALSTQTICLDGTFNALTVATQNGTGTPTYQWFSNSVNSTSNGTLISGATNSSFTPPSNVVGTTYYYCVATFASGGCSSITSTVATATVVADPVISAQPIASQSICVGGTIATALTAASTGGTGTTSYQWSNASGPITGATNQTYLPPNFATVGQYLYSVTITLSGSGCNALTTQNALIDVIADPIVSTQPISASYCQNGSPVAPLTISASGGVNSNYIYQWYNGTSLISGATSNSYIPSVAATGTINYTCQVSIDPSAIGCTVTSNAATIQVNPAPTFSTPALPTQTVCLDGTFNALTVATQNGTGSPTYQWFSNNANSTSNGTLISGATNSSFTPPSNAVGTTYYYCVATFASGGCSAITSTVATAIVVADPVISAQPIASQSICVGGTIATALTAAATGGTGTTSYQWSNASGPIAGASNQTYLPPSFTTVGQYSYSVTITLSGSGCNALTTQNALIDVVADPIVDTQPVSASYCQNGSPVAPLSVTATGGIGTYLYQWYSNTSNSNSGGVLIPGATNSSFTPSVSAIGTTYYYCSITQTGLNCNVTSNTAAIIVNQAPAFIDQPLSQTICIGGTFTPLSVTYQYGTGIPCYQWYSNSVNSYTGAVAITGATNPSYQPNASSVSNIYYFCQISFSFGGCTSISSLISNQIVVDDPVITSQPLNNQTICVGGTIPSSLLINVSGGTGTTTYQWYAGSNAISGATQNSFVPSIYNNPGIYDYTVNISSSGVGCAALTSQVATVEVLADPLISAPLAATYCQNASPITALQVTVTGGAGTNTYQWYASATNTTTAGTPVSNATTSSYTPPVNTVGIVYYYCIVTQSTPNCANTSLNAPIQVNLPPTISVQPIATQTLCEGGSPTPLQIAYINGTNSATYQWYSNNVNSNTGGTPLLNETNPTYTPPSILTGTVFYYCVITFQQGGCSSLTSISAQVTVVNDPAISLQPLAAQEICQGNTINNPLTFNYTGGTGNSTIAWYLDVNPPILINGITTNSYLPIPFNVADTFNYYATLTFDGVGCNVATTQLASIIVHPTPYVTNLDDTLVLCNNGVLDIPLTASVTSTFQWDTPQTSSVNGESFLTQTSYSIDDSLTNTTTTPQFLTYSVTPTSFPYGCVGPDSTVVIQVQPDVILSMNQAIEICSGSPVNGILTSNIPSTFNWFVSIDNPNVTGESILPSTNWLVNDVLVNTSTVNQVVVYSVFPVSIQGSCPGLAQPLVVTVKPPIDILNPDTLTICSGSNVGINLVANTNVQFNWYASPSLNVLNETTSVVSSSTINDQLVNPTNAVEIVTYNVIGTSTANGCSSPVLPLYVVVNPIPSLVNLNPLTICNGNYLYPYSLQTSVTGATTNWSVLNNPIGIPSSFGSNTLPGFIATNNTIVTQTGQILITPIFTNNNITCIGADTTLLIPVLPTPSVNNVSDIVVCNLEQVPLTPINGPVPNSYFEWINSNIGTGLNATGIGDIPIFVGLNPGTAPLTGTVSVTPYYTQNNVTCQGTTIDFDITVNPSPVLINNDIEICDQEFTNILLNANISSSFIWNAQIQPNVYNETAAPIQTSALINDQLVLATTTQQTVTYNVTPISTPYGCFGNDTTIEVIVHPLPVVDFTVLTPILCDQSQINFQNNSVGSLDYTWTFGDGGSSFLFNPVHEYANFGSYLVQLEAIDQITGCYNQDSQDLTINESPEADFILSDSIACGSLDVVFNALDLNPNWTYLWTFGDGTSSNQYGLAGHQYVTNGCFDVTLQISTPQGCVSDTTQLDAVCIYPEPIAAFTMDDPVISSLTPEVQFFNSSLYADTYFWDFGDGTTSITENPNHLFTSDPATYVIVLTASNQIGCMDTAALTVTVWQDLAIYVPNTFTPDGDEHNQTFKPILTEGFKKDSYHLMIFNRWGEVVFESYDVEYGWDGTFSFNEIGPYDIPLLGKRYFIKEMLSPTGTYTWKIEITELQSGETRRFLGHVNLIR